MRTIEGSCDCGAIHYRSAPDPTETFNYDCRGHQERSHMRIAESVGVPGESLKVRGLVPSVYEEKGKEQSSTLRSFCPNCGTTLFLESDTNPEIVQINASTLDDKSRIESNEVLFGAFPQVNRARPMTTYHRSPTNLQWEHER